MLLGHLLTELREAHRSSPQSPNQQVNYICPPPPIEICWLKGSPGANECSELEQIITILIILIGCCFQVVHKLVIGDDFLQLSIANTKNVAEIVDSLPICLSMT